MKSKFLLWLLVAPIMGWVFLGLLGGRISARVAARFGPRIVAQGDGKFTNAESFVSHRLTDGVVLLTAGCWLILAGLVIDRASHFIPTRVRWITKAIVGFVFLNIFVAVAGHTVLFWCLLFSGKDHTHNYTQYRLKQGLMKEADVSHQAVLMGSSQTRAEMDAKIFNEKLGQKIWTTELHFPGSWFYDMSLSLERLPPAPVDYIITYVSEGYFYTSGNDERLLFFFGFRDLANYETLPPGKPAFDRNAVCGLLGDAVPLFQFREPLEYRILGWKMQHLDQEQYDEALDANLLARAKLVAPRYHQGAECDFHKSQFVNFAKKCRERHCRWIVCCGQLNPILGRVLDPALRPDMIAFLRDQAKHDPNIVLLEESQLPRQTEKDYDDLTHVNLAARKIFTEYLVEVMKTQMRSN